MCKTSRQSDPFTVSLSDKRHSVTPGRPVRGPLMPHVCGKPFLLRQSRAKCHRRVRQGGQTEGSQSQSLISPNSPDRRLHRIVHNAAHAARCVACQGGGSHPVPVALVGECSIPVTKNVARQPRSSY